MNEIIVVDDGSSDNSKKIIKKIADANKLVTYIFQENKGLASARNTGIKKSSGNFIAFLDGDDVWKKDKLAYQVEKFKNDKTLGLTYTNYTDFNSKFEKKIIAKRYIGGGDEILKKYFVNDAPILPSTVMVRKKVFDDVGVFDPVLRWGQDTDMWLRIINKWKILHINKDLVNRRRHGNSLSDNHEKKREYGIFVAEKASLKYPVLKSLKGKRIARVHRNFARIKMENGIYFDAVQASFEAIKNDILFWKNHAMLVISLIKYFNDSVKNKICSVRWLNI